MVDGAWLRELVVLRRRGDDGADERDLPSKSLGAFGAGFCFATSSNKVVCSSTFRRTVSKHTMNICKVAYIGQFPGVNLGHLKNSNPGAYHQEGEDDCYDDRPRCLKALVKDDGCQKCAEGDWSNVSDRDSLCERSSLTHNVVCWRHYNLDIR